MIFTPIEFYVVQTRQRATSPTHPDAPAPRRPIPGWTQAEEDDSQLKARAALSAELRATTWRDERTYDEDGPAFDWADYLREDGDSEARVVRRWR